MKKDLLITLADKNFIKQAKQLFSSAYWNAGWSGDYMLLACGIPERDLKWFRDKGILVKKCELIFDELKDNRWPSVVISKINIFKKEFKKWENIIFLDADITIRNSLDELKNVRGLNAVSHKTKLRLEFSIDDPEELKLYKEMVKKYDLKDQEAFNSGVLAFNTGIITRNTFRDLNNLILKYKSIAQGDEPILNLYFKNWNRLPIIYNSPPNGATLNFEIEDVKGAIIHFLGTFLPKPWDPRSKFYSEWSKNLKKAEKIDLDKIPRGKNLWTKEEEREYEEYYNNIYNEKKKDPYWLNWQIFSKAYHKKIGRLGIKLKKKSPKLYYFLGGKN